MHILLVKKICLSCSLLRKVFIASFHLYKNGENLKILTEIFRQKHIVSNVILTFLDHLKPKILFVDQPWWLTYPLLFKIIGFAPVHLFMHLVSS